LFPRFPCFGAIDVTFLEKPFIDFSLRVVSFDLMNLGVDELNASGQSALQSLPFLLHLSLSLSRSLSRSVSLVLSSGEQCDPITDLVHDDLPEQIPYPHRP
jgi:hypothetical protein